MPKLKQTMYHAWTLQGELLTSLLDLHPKCQIIVVSPDSKFRGIKGLDRFYVVPDERPKQDTSSVHPKPKTWIQGQAISWIRQNDTTNLPNLNDTTGSLVLQNSKEFKMADNSVFLMEALREEHVRVHM
jgi:hypothetical protein